MEIINIEVIAHGHIIKDLLQQFYPNSKPKKFIEIFSGGGTGKDVAKELQINNSLHLDLNNGWDALIDEIPSGQILFLPILPIVILSRMNFKEIHTLKMIYLIKCLIKSL